MRTSDQGNADACWIHAEYDRFLPDPTEQKKNQNNKLRNTIRACTKTPGLNDRDVRLQDETRITGNNKPTQTQTVRQWLYTGRHGDKIYEYKQLRTTAQYMHACRRCHVLSQEINLLILTFSFFKVPVLLWSESPWIDTNNTCYDFVSGRARLCNFPFDGDHFACLWGVYKQRLTRI